MAIPEFVLTLRAKIGQDPLPLNGVMAVVLDDAARVLLVRRSDNQRWTLVSGCIEPGEQPAAGIVREIEEETGVVATVERLISIEALELEAVANGDQVWWTAIGFKCRYVGGAARVNDDESVDVGWFDPADLPATLPPHHRRCLDLALADRPEAWFQRV